MSTDTGIQWTDHTFNPWWGCVKVHRGCKNCYAETWDKRCGGDHWGRGPRRMILGEWGKPSKWNALAEAAGNRASVFCASMCDLFESYDGPVVNQQGQPCVRRPAQPGGGGGSGPEFWTVPLLRARVFEIIDETPWLDWQLLTKRPENVVSMVPVKWLHPGGWPTNVWTGTSPCDQETADASLPALMRVPGRRFLSCEPLLGPLDITSAVCTTSQFDKAVKLAHADGFVTLAEAQAAIDRHRAERGGGSCIDWVIVGGESGKDARPCSLSWIASIIKQCRDAGVPVFVKQLGARPLGPKGWAQGGWLSGQGGEDGGEYERKLREPHGGDMNEWPEDLRVRQEMPR